jgi:gluconolactonase
LLQQWRLHLGANTPETNVPIGPNPEYEGGSIERIDLSTGKVERLYDSCDGVKLAGPNDIMFDRNGGFWFSDLGVDTGTSELHGGIYYAMPDGSSIRRMVYGIGINGIGISPEGRTIYGAASNPRTLLAFDVDAASKSGATGFMSDAPGVKAEIARGPAAGRVLACFPGHHFLDSLAMEADGTIAQAVVFGAKGIARVNVQTGDYEMIATPDHLTTNIAFGGPDMQTAYVTLSSRGAIGRMRWPAPGLRLPYNI